MSSSALRYTHEAPGVSRAVGLRGISRFLEKPHTTVQPTVPLSGGPFLFRRPPMAKRKADIHDAGDPIPAASTKPRSSIASRCATRSSRWASKAAYEPSALRRSTSAGRRSIAGSKPTRPSVKAGSLPTRAHRHSRSRLAWPVSARATPSMIAPGRAGAQSFPHSYKENRELELSGVGRCAGNSDRAVCRRRQALMAINRLASSPETGGGKRSPGQ